MLLGVGCWFMFCVEVKGLLFGWGLVGCWFIFCVEENGLFLGWGVLGVGVLFFVGFGVLGVGVVGVCVVGVGVVGVGVVGVGVVGVVVFGVGFGLGLGLGVGVGFVLGFGVGFVVVGLLVGVDFVEFLSELLVLIVVCSLCVIGGLMVEDGFFMNLLSFFSFVRVILLLMLSLVVILCMCGLLVIIFLFELVYLDRVDYQLWMGFILSCLFCFYSCLVFVFWWVLFEGLCVQLSGYMQCLFESLLLQSGFYVFGCWMYLCVVFWQDSMFIGDEGVVLGNYFEQSGVGSMCVVIDVCLYGFYFIFVFYFVLFVDGCGGRLEFGQLRMLLGWMLIFVFVSLVVSWVFWFFLLMVSDS